MTLPKLSESELEEINEDFIKMINDFDWFINVSGIFFNNMYGNIYENCEEEDNEEEDNEEEDD